MFINKVGNGINSQAFRGYQHEINDTGYRELRFNYPHDDAYVEFYKAKRNPEYYSGWQIYDNRNNIAKTKIEKNGISINPQNIVNLEEDETLAYKIVDGYGNVLPESGMRLDGCIIMPKYGTTPMVQGSAVLTMPDLHRPGAYYKGFDDENTGEIVYDINKQKEAEGTTRTFSNHLGGSLAGLEYDIPLFKEWGVKVLFSTPVVGDDNVSAFRYWPENNMQIAEEMGNTENYSSFLRKLYQNGMIYVYDATLTSEGLQSRHFQYAARWADKNPQTYYWFKMTGLKKGALGLGLTPEHDENLRLKSINPPVIYNEAKNEYVKNPDYDENKETYIQYYDVTQVTKEQAESNEIIKSYDNIKTENPLSMNTHDDTSVSNVVEVKANDYIKSMKKFVEFNKNNDAPVKWDSANGALLFSQFPHFKLIKKTEGGYVTWDANTDMVKLKYHISGYDEKIRQAIPNLSERDYEKKREEIGVKEIQDLAIQSGVRWVGMSRIVQTLYTAQTLKNASSVEAVDKLIKDGKLPDEVKLSQNALNNIISGVYNLSPKGVLEKDKATVKALTKLPLDSLEFGNNTVEVLSTSFFSNRATTENTIGMSRFDLMEQGNPHLIEPYTKTYTKVDSLYQNELKEFADRIIEKINETSDEKLLEDDGNYTEYGEYVIELLGQDITKYAFLKSLTGSKLKTKILPNGEITYDYKDIKNNTTLQSLGINAHSPEDEANQLESLIEKGLKRLNSDDVEYVAKSISQRIAGTNTDSFRIAEAMVDKASLGLAIRLDAAKDVIDWDAVRNGDLTFDEAWDLVIDFLKKYVDAVKAENPNVYIVAELTDIADLMRETLGAITNISDKSVNVGQKYKTEDDAMRAFFLGTGITSEAAYSYTFTEFLKIFSADLTNGDFNQNIGEILNKLQKLTNNRSADYIRNLWSFMDNHDKPSVIHGMALNMGLFYANLENNKWARTEVMKQLTNSDDFNSLPLEARLNIDNLDYYRTASTRAAAMSKLMRECINENLYGVVSDEEITFLKEALVDLTNGNFLEDGISTQIPSINVSELSSLEAALKSMKLNLSEEDTKAILENAAGKIDKYAIKGNLTGDSDIDNENRQRVETMLRGENQDSPSGETDYTQYSLYAAAIAGILGEAYYAVMGNKADDTAKRAFLNARRDFVKKYDNAYIKANSTPIPFVENSKYSTKKNGYAAKDFRTVIKMLIEQAEYKARKQKKLGENEHFKDADNIYVKLFRSATEPAVQKSAMLMTFLSGFPGIPSIFVRDMLCALGYEEKAKNIYLQNRNAVTWSELEEGPLKEYITKVMNMFTDILNIRKRDGIDALNHGTPYALPNNEVPAILMQDGKGNMTVSLFNASGIKAGDRESYNSQLYNNDMDAAESINHENKYVPVQGAKVLSGITIPEELRIPIGTAFKNSDTRDKEKYVVKWIDGVRKLIRESVYGNEIVMNGTTAKNGVMILKHVAFRGKNLNKRYNILSNPYKKVEEPVEGQNLSIIAK